MLELQPRAGGVPSPWWWWGAGLDPEPIPADPRGGGGTSGSRYLAAEVEVVGSKAALEQEEPYGETP